MRRFWIAVLCFTLAALGLRLFVALRVASDCSGDGPVYEQLALNVLEHGSYSLESEAPYRPSLIRMPGYPLVLAAIFALFGKGNILAVHVVQTVVDTGTCWAAALLCFLWTPLGWDPAKRRRATLWTFAMMALCPFAFVYTGTLLTETWALFFGTLCVTAGVWALEARNRGCARWALSGFLGGLGCLFRPDLGLFLAALGLVMVSGGITEALRARKEAGLVAAARAPVRRMVISGLVFSLAFIAVLAPWAVRNARTFHLFQPLAPPSANMPDEFVATGYGTWVKTWITQPKDVEFFIWDLEERPMDVSRLPARAIDSPREHERVVALFDRYNKGDKAGAPSSQADAVQVMTPAMDAGFAALAKERVSRHPLDYFLLLPVRRAWNMWFDPHAIYYPFDGDLFPLSNLDPSTGQVVLLPLFYLQVWFYTLLALLGVRVWWTSPGCGRWALLLGLLFVPRIAFLSTLANPEPRYMIELFPFVAAAGGVALAAEVWRRVPRPSPELSPGECP